MMPESAPTEHNHAIAAASRRAAAVRIRFDRELDELIDAIHELRETIHGHPLPYDGTERDGQHEDRP